MHINGTSMLEFLYRHAVHTPPVVHCI